MSLQPMRTPPFVGGTQIDPVTGLPVRGVMGFPALPPPQRPQPQGAMEKIFGLLSGPTQSYGGLFSPDDEKAARNRALMTMGANLLAGSGPSPIKRGTGELIAQSWMAGQNAKDQYEQNALQTLVLKAQLDKAKQKDRGKLVAVIDPVTNKPVYKYEGEASGMTVPERSHSFKPPVTHSNKVRGLGRNWPSR